MGTPRSPPPRARVARAARARAKAKAKPELVHPCQGHKPKLLHRFLPNMLTELRFEVGRHFLGP